MSKKIAAVWLVVMMILCVIVILVEVAQRVEAPTIYVDDDYVIETPFQKKTISAAVENASDGYIIYVYAGNYTENVVIDKRIDLIGENRDTTIVNGGGSGTIFLISSDWVNITGFNITNGDSGIYSWKKSNNSIINNKIYSNRFSGIELRSSNNNIISNNIVLNSSNAIFIQMESNNNIILNNTASENFNGILIWESSNNNITNNSISYNYYGIYLTYYSTFNLINNNNISNNDYGIDSFRSSYNNFMNNKLVDDGIILRGGELSHFNTHTISVDNEVNGKPIFYYKNQSNFNRIGIPVGQLILANCSEVNAEDLQIHNADVGIEIAYSKNINIKNNNITDNYFSGLYLYDVSDINLSGNDVLNSIYGFYFYGSSNSNISNNNVSNSNYGIYIERSPTKNLITYNHISDNDGGIVLSDSWYHHIANNTFINNGISLKGTELSYYNTHTIPDDNYVNGKPLYYYKNQTGFDIVGIPVGQLILANCTNINVKNLQINNTDIGLLIAFSTNIEIANNNIFTNNDYGIYLYESMLNNIINNTVSDHNYSLYFYDVGIYLYESEHNNISDNNITNNYRGISLYWYSDSNNIINNNILNNEQGTHFTVAFYNNLKNNHVIDNGIGIYMDGAEKNNISHNIITSNNICGIRIFFADENEVNHNYISYNGFGIYIGISWSNKIYHNNFIDNTNQSFDDEDHNYWDNGYPSGGNYWSDYVGVDNFKGPDQDIPGRDGIGDSNYSIDSDSIDNYPLMEPIENYTILNQGWNLISTPLVQEDQNLIKVLEMIDGYYDAVQWYDVRDTDDQWKHYKVGKSYGNDLAKLNETKGFWIYMNPQNGAVLLHNGTIPTSNQTIQLYPGWNMVGYPSLSNHNRNVGLNNLTYGQEVDLIQWYDSSNQKWHDMDEDDYFVLGGGYWVHTITQCIWEVPL